MDKLTVLKVGGAVTQNKLILDKFLNNLTKIKASNFGGSRFIWGKPNQAINITNRCKAPDDRNPNFIDISLRFLSVCFWKRLNFTF